jgi:hypothetical protein
MIIAIIAIIKNIKIVFINLDICPIFFVLFLYGNGISGIGTSKNLQRGPQPSLTL